MLKILLVDDEAPARARVKRMLHDLSEVQVLDEAQNGIEALEKIESLKPDLVLLDIEMPELSGLEVEIGRAHV